MDVLGLDVLGQPAGARRVRSSRRLDFIMATDVCRGIAAKAMFRNWGSRVVTGKWQEMTNLNTKYTS